MWWSAQRRIYQVTLNLCDHALKTKLEHLTDWVGINQRRDVIELLRNISNIVYDSGDNKHIFTTIVNLQCLYYAMKQGNLTCEKWKEAKLNLAAAIEALGGTVTACPGWEESRAAELAVENGRVDADGNATPNNDIYSVAASEAKENMEAAAILSGANSRFNEYKASLDNSYAQGNDIYPTSAAGAVAAMNSYSSVYALGRHAENERARHHQLQERQHDDGQGGAMFLQHNDAAPSAELNNRRFHPSAIDKLLAAPGTCPHCGEDHSIAACPNLSDEARQSIRSELLTVAARLNDGASGGTLLSGKHRRTLRPNYLYLDTCTTDDVMAQAKYLSAIVAVLHPLLLQTNGGDCSSNEIGYLESTRFWLDRSAIANVISLSTVETLFDEVYYHSKRSDRAIICKNDNGDTVVFHRFPDTGFPYIDLEEEGSQKAAVFIQTVRRNFEGFTSRDVEKAIEARRLQSIVGHPSESVLKHEVSRTDDHSLLRDSQVSPHDIDNANKIFGPSLPIVQGKSTRTKPNKVEPQYIPLPQQVVDRYQYLTLVADVMFVNGLPFFVTLSRKVRFVTAQFFPRRTAAELSNVVKETIDLYRRAGFVCQTALMDGEFEKLVSKLSDQIVVNVCSKNEHVGEIEAKIKDIKNRCRSITASLPYNVLPNAIIKSLVHHAIMMMNAFPASQGVSQTYSPRELVLRWQLGKQHLVAPFGCYCTVYDDPDRTNTNEPRVRAYPWRWCRWRDNRCDEESCFGGLFKYYHNGSNFLGRMPSPLCLHGRWTRARSARCITQPSSIRSVNLFEDGYSYFVDNWPLLYFILRSSVLPAAGEPSPSHHH